MTGNRKTFRVDPNLPVLPQPISEKDYSLRKAKEVFEPLTPLSTLADQAKNIDQKFSRKLVYFNSILNDTGQDKALESYALKAAEELNLDNLSKTIEDKKSLIEQLTSQTQESFASSYAEYVNKQERINYFKNCLAQAIHTAAGLHFNKLQREAIEGLDKEKIDSFNKQFEGFATLLPDNSISDINEIYKNISKKSLEQIAKAITTLVNVENNPSIQWTPVEQKQLITKINVITNEIKNTFKDKPFEAWENAYLGMGKPGFQWNKAVLEKEVSLLKISNYVKNTLNSHFKEIPQLNFANEETQLTEVEKSLYAYQTKIDDHKKLLALKHQAQDIQTKTKNLLFTHDGKERLPSIQNEIKQKYTEIEECSKDPLTFIIKGNPTQTNEFVFLDYVNALVNSIQYDNEKITAITSNINKVDELNTINPSVHLNHIEERVTNLSERFDLLSKKNQELKNITDDLKQYHIIAIHNNKLEKLKTFQQHLKKTCSDIDSKYSLSKTSKYKSHVGIQSLIAKFQEHKTAIQKLDQIYSQIKDVDDDEFLARLQNSKKSLLEHNDALRDFHKEILESVSLLAKTKPMPSAPKAKHNTVPLTEPPTKRRQPTIFPPAMKQSVSDCNIVIENQTPPADENFAPITSPTKPQAPKDSFLKKHWGKMLVGFLGFSALAVAGAFTGGLIPILAGVVSSSTVAAGIVTATTAAAGGAIGVGAGALVGAVAGDPPKDGGLFSFIKKHAKKIAIGAGVGIVGAGLIALSVVSFGAPAAVFAAIGAGTAASAAIFGTSMGSTAAGLLGSGLITAGSSIVGAIVSLFGGSIAEGSHFHKTPSAKPDSKTTKETRSFEKDADPFPDPKTPTNTPNDQTFNSAEINEKLMDVLKTMEQKQAELDHLIFEEEKENNTGNVVTFPTKKFSETGLGLHSPQNEKKNPGKKLDSEIPAHQFSIKKT